MPAMSAVFLYNFTRTVLQCLQQTPAHVLPVCCCQCPFLCCGVLGRQHEEEGCRATRQAGEEGGSCCGHRTGLPNISGGEKDPEYVTDYLGQCPPPTTHYSQQTEEHIQWHTPVTVMLIGQAEEVIVHC